MRYLTFEFLNCRREIVGRSIFSSTFDVGALGNGVNYWRGFYQSLRPTQMGLSLNVGTFKWFNVYSYGSYITVCSF